MPNLPSRRESGKIFISYRREDSETMAGRIFDWLSDRMPRETVFIDIDTVDYGANFVQRIAETIPQCRAMLVVIGPHWLTDAGDLSHHVRLEIEQALQHQVQIIPLLVEGASIPSAEQVPVSVRELVYLNAATIRSGRDFRRDMEDVARSLDLPARLPDDPNTPPRATRRLSRRVVLTAAAGAAGVVGVATLGIGAQRWIASRSRVYPFARGSVLYIFEEDSADLYALNVPDGSLRWKLHTAAEFTRFTPLTAGTTVFMGTNDGTVYALDGDTGTVRWQQSVPGAGIDSAFAAGGALYVNTGPRAGSTAALPTLYAFSADSGSLRWQASNFSATLAQDAVYGFLTARRTVNGFNSDRVAGLGALDVTDGKPRWSYLLQTLGEFAVSASAPVLLDRSLYFAPDIGDLDSSETSTAYAVDATSGTLRWQAPTTGKSTLLLPLGDIVYASSQLASPAVLALNAQDGSLRWRFPVTPGIPDELGEPSAPTVAGDALLFAADGVYELERQTGTILSHYLTGLGIDASQPLIADDLLYVTSPGFDESSYAINTYATVYAVSRRSSDRPLVWKMKLPSGRADDLTIVGNMLVFTSGADGLYVVNRATGSTLWRFRVGKNRFTALAVGP
jgi:outer membrane protein assembly factor BamB